MAINDITIEKSKGLFKKNEQKKDIYISYNSLSQRGEIKSVSQAMTDFIKGGFEKLTPKKV